jgi:hypothetical protein
MWKTLMDSHDGQLKNPPGTCVADGQGADIENSESKGLIPRIVEQIFASIMVAEVTIEYTVKVSYMEIYMEKIKDLLARELPRLAEGEKLTDSS